MRYRSIGRADRAITVPRGSCAIGSALRCRMHFDRFMQALLQVPKDAIDKALGKRKSKRRRASRNVTPNTKGKDS